MDLEQHNRKYRKHLLAGRVRALFSPEFTPPPPPKKKLVGVSEFTLPKRTPLLVTGSINA